MRNLILILIVLLASATCYAFEFGASYSIRSAKTEGCKMDYEAALLFETNRTYFEWEKERESDQYYTSYELQYKRSWFNLVNSRFTALNIQSDDTKFICLDVLYSLKFYDVGVGIKKQDGKYLPHAIIMSEYKIEKAGNDLFYSAGITTDFCKINYNIDCRFTQWLAEHFGVYGKLSFKKYNKLTTAFKMGVQIKI